jgi:hypothetical protein
MSSGNETVRALADLAPSRPLQVEDLLLENLTAPNNSLDSWREQTGKQNRDPAMKDLDLAVKKAAGTAWDLNDVMRESRDRQNLYAETFLRPELRKDGGPAYHAYWQDVAEAARDHRDAIQTIDEALKAAPSNTPYPEARAALGDFVGDAFKSMQQIEAAVQKGRSLVGQMEPLRGPASVNKATLSDLVQEVNQLQRRRELEQLKKDLQPPEIPRLLSSQQFVKGSGRSLFKIRGKKFKAVDNALKENEQACSRYDKLSAVHAAELTQYLTAVNKNPSDLNAREQYLGHRWHLAKAFSEVTHSNTAARAALDTYHFGKAKPSSRDGAGQLTELKNAADGASELIRKGQDKLARDDARIWDSAKRMEQREAGLAKEARLRAWLQGIPDSAEHEYQGRARAAEPPREGTTTSQVAVLPQRRPGVRRTDGPRPDAQEPQQRTRPGGERRDTQLPSRSSSPGQNHGR